MLNTFKQHAFLKQQKALLVQKQNYLGIVSRPSIWPAEDVMSTHQQLLLDVRKLLAWEADHAEGYTTKPTLVPSRARRRGKKVKREKKREREGGE